MYVHVYLNTCCVYATYKHIPVFGGVAPRGSCLCMCSAGAHEWRGGGPTTKQKFPRQADNLLGIGLVVCTHHNYFGRVVSS